MKWFILALISFSALANDVITVQNQKLVLIEQKTAIAVDKVIKSNAAPAEKVEKYKAIFKKETAFCSAAA